MALHRDIYWVGKQWAVTGFGVQACDQKQKVKFDIPVEKLWDDDVLESMRALKWLNAEDFANALSIARQRYPEPPRKAAPPKKATPPEEKAPLKVSAVPAKASAPAPAKPEPPKPAPAKPAIHKFHLQTKGSAKFLPQWRVRYRR
jgi:hypothetical protein